MLEIWVLKSTCPPLATLSLTYTDPEAQEKLRRSMSGEDNNENNNYTTTGGNSGAQEFERSVGTGSAPGATFAGGAVTATNMHGVPADKDVPSSTRDTGFGVDPDSSKNLSGNTANTGSATHSSGNQTFRVQDSPAYGSTTTQGGSNNQTFRAQDSPAHSSNQTFRAQDSPAHSSSHTSHGAGAAAGAAGAAVAGTAALASSNVDPSTRDTGYGVDPNQSREVSDTQSSGQSNTGKFRSGAHLHEPKGSTTSALGGSTGSNSNTNTLGSNTQTSHGDSTSHSHGLSGAAAGAAVGGTAASAASNVNPSTRDTGYGIDPNQSREVGGNSNTASTDSTPHTQSANIPVSASAPVGSSSHSGSGALGTSGVGAAAATGSGIPPSTQRGGDTSHLNTSDNYDGSTRTPSNTISSHQAGAAGAATGGTSALAGSNVPPTTRDTGYGVDPNQSREVGGSNTGSNTGTTHNNHTTTRGTTDTPAGHTSPSDEINKAAHDHGAAGAAGAALGLAVGGTSATDSSIPSTTRDTGYGIDPAASDGPTGNSAPGFNTMTPNSKLANPDGTSRDFSGNNNSDKRDISDNASTRALASNSNKDLPSTGDSTHNTNPEEEHVDVDGPGPRPVADVAAEHGGDAGKATSDEVSTSSGNKSGGLAGEHGTDAPKHDDVKAEGTGEKWVKTSGLAADGGDFDATKPGAGREADRKSTLSLQTYTTSDTN